MSCSAVDKEIASIINSSLGHKFEADWARVLVHCVEAQGLKTGKIYEAKFLNGNTNGLF